MQELACRLADARAHHGVPTLTELPQLTSQVASQLARLALHGVQREYPNKLDHVLQGPDDLASPRALHPAFYGCFDWHSAVHGHWLLARMLRLVPALQEAAEIRAALDHNLTAANIAAERAYLSRQHTGSFERTYGWAWLLKLAEELEQGTTPVSTAWARSVRPLAEAFVERYLAYLPKLQYPIRAGVHANTAFGLAFAHDYAVASGHGPLRELVERKAHDFFGRDADYPAHLEPGGSDFLSPALMEAELMRRVLEPHVFVGWFERFLPGASSETPSSLFSPVSVSDRTDLQIVHLDGLNLSRGWCFRKLAQALPEGHPAASAMCAGAARHAAAALPNVASGDYAGEHWLATFALLLLTE
jgi:hypothetical protein